MSVCPALIVLISRIRFFCLFKYLHASEEEKIPLFSVIVYPCLVQSPLTLLTFCVSGAAHKGSSPPPQVANINGVSPVLSANKHAALPLSHDAPTIPLSQKPAGLGQNTLNFRSQTKPVPNHSKYPDYKSQWVKNQSFSRYWKYKFHCLKLLGRPRMGKHPWPKMYRRPKASSRLSSYRNFEVATQETCNSVLCLRHDLWLLCLQISNIMLNFLLLLNKKISFLVMF